jgi:hypothetical protein
MKRASLIFAGLAFSALLSAQNPKPAEVPKPTPALSTADKVAIQTFEKAKVDAQKQWNDAEQSEVTVLREWQVAHPGWHIHYNPQGNDPQNFAIESDAKPQAKAAAPAPAAK